jgi:formiminoglutamase
MFDNLLPAQLQLRPSGVDPDSMGYQMVAGWITPWDFKEPLDVGLIGAPCNLGPPFWLGTHEGPSAIREAFSHMATRSFDYEVDVRDLRVRDVGDVRMHLTDTVRTHANIENTLYEIYRHNPDFVPIIMGGDHSIAAPSARAYQRAHDQILGLIDFDAHNDLRNPAAEGPSSGTPFRQLIDGGFVRGKSAVQVGLHGFLSSPALKAYADTKGLRMIPAREVRRRGIDTVMDEAMDQATTGTEGVYVSLDIDVMDSAFAHGTGSPTGGGLEPREMLEAIYRLGACPQVRALDLVELDPLRDVKGATAELASIIILTFMAGIHARKFGAPSRPAADGVSTTQKVAG